MNELYYYIREDSTGKINNYQFLRNVRYSQNIDISFISSRIYSKIKNTEFQQYTYSDIINSIDINLTIYEPIKVLFKKDIDDNIDDNIDNIILIISKLVNLCNNKSINQLDITIFLMSDKKEITNDTSIIGDGDVNSGCSIVNNINNKIYIWRKEEVNKVLIHELIHSLDLDPITNYNYDFFLTKFSYCPKEINLFESYVEFWATLINILFVMAKNKSEFSSFETFIENEIEFGYKQSSKLLIYNDIYNFKDFYSTNHNITSCKFKEESNVFMYYLGKLLLLINYREVLNLCELYRKGYILNIKRSYEFTEKLINIMLDSLDEGAIDKFNYLLKLKYNNSLRMSYYG